MLVSFAGMALASHELSIVRAIELAGHQRMLSQRITKSYLQVGLGAHADEARWKLLEAMETFEQQLAELQRSAPSANVSAALDRVAALWVPFQRSASGEPDKDTARRLGIMDEELLAACEEVTALLQDFSGKSVGRLVNMAGRQRMLSQRLAKFYLFQAAGLGRPSMDAEMDRVRNEFKGALMTLRAARQNPPIVVHNLEEAAQQFAWLESSLEMDTQHKYPLIVIDASEKILELMEEVTNAYADMGTEPH